VVAYALAGTTDIDLTNEPLGQGKDGPVYLRDIWPSHSEIQQTLSQSVLPEMFVNRYSGVFDSNEMWNIIKVAEGDLYQWDDASTYIQEPPFLSDLTVATKPIQPIQGARVLAMLGDSVTTDHISPAGNISKNSPAGRFLIEHGVESADFNSYGSRRGNDRVMVRGTFANIRIRNFLAPGTEGGVTRCFIGQAVNAPSILPIYDAAMAYKKAGVPTIILAGTEYGTGSSRDWAAKGTMLLGVRAVIAASFERIHRSNLVNMGVLPLEFPAGQNWKTLGLSGEETFEILGLDDSIQPRSTLTVKATAVDGSVKTFEASVRIDTPVELDYYKNGGILQTVVRKLLAT
jgi:aconitate hydratase